MSVDVSPDGRLLAFDLLGQIFVMPVGGGRARQLTVGPAYAERPRFSKDGRFLIFNSDLSGSNMSQSGPRKKQPELWRLPVTGGAAPTRVQPADTAGGPAWSDKAGESSWYDRSSSNSGRFTP